MTEGREKQVSERKGCRQLSDTLILFWFDFMTKWYFLLEILAIIINGTLDDDTLKRLYGLRKKSIGYTDSFKTASLFPLREQSVIPTFLPKTVGFTVLF